MCGSNASRRPSPSKLNAITVVRIANPGKVLIHQARSKKARPSAVILTEDEIIAEAVYTLELFHREGTIKYEALCGGDADMHWQWHALQRFVKRYDYPERPKNLYEKVAA